MHYFTINEAERSPKPDVLHHRRRFWNGKRAEGHIETIIVHPVARFAANFHVGNAGSETPFDGHLILFGSGFYWGVSWGRKLAQRITSSPEHKYDSRDIGFNIFEGRFYLSAWIPADRWKRGEFARWRNLSFSVNPLDWFFGPKRFSYTNIEKADVELDMVEGRYPATLTLQECVLKRTRGRVLKRESTVDVSVHGGVPTEPESWKGGSTYGYGVKVSGERRSWVREGKLAAEAWVLNQRARRGFIPEAA